MIISVQSLSIGFRCILFVFPRFPTSAGMGQGKNRYEKTDLDLQLGCQKVFAKVNARVPSCDVVLKVEGTAFFCSRLVLGAWSPYFDRIFNVESDAASYREIDLHGVSRIGFRAIWEFLHGPEFFMDGEDGTLAILRDAHFLGIKHLCGIVCNQLLEVLETRNAFLFLRAAQELDEKELEEEILSFVARCFRAIVETPGFVEMTLDMLTGLLLRDDIVVESEEEVFHASRVWVEYDSERKEYWPDVLRAVRLPLLTYDFLRRHVMSDPDIQDDERCDGLLLEAKNYRNPRLHDFVPAVPERSRRYRADSCLEATEAGAFPHQPSEVFFLAKSSDDRKTIVRMNAKCRELHHVTDHPYPTKEFYKRCFSAIRKRLYLAGEGELKVFDMEDRRWRSGPTPLVNANHPTCASSPTSLFLCGGRDNRSVCELDLQGQKWMRLSDTIHPRADAAAAMRHSTLHLIGGVYNGIVKKKMKEYERMDVREGRWEELAPLPQERSWSAAVFHNDQLHVAGGFGSEGRRRKELYLYEERAHKWISLQSMNEGRVCHGLISFEGRLYAIGGYLNSTMEYFNGREWKVARNLRFVECQQACFMI